MLIISGFSSVYCIKINVSEREGEKYRRRTHPPGFLPLSRACGRTRAIEYESQVSTISQDARDGYVVVHGSFFFCL